MTAQTDSRLPREVFDAISTRLASRTGDIASFAETRYSFEEWLNWEAFAACKARPQWKVDPKPSYSGLFTAQPCKDLGDLLVTDEDSGWKVLVEVGLVHDGTRDKWLAKLEADRQKVCRAFVGNVIGLQLIVLTSTKDIPTDKVWQDWLNRVACWNEKGSWQKSAPLPPSGQMIIRGWASGTGASSAA